MMPPARDEFQIRGNFIQLWKMNAESLKTAALAVWATGNVKMRIGWFRSVRIQRLGPPAKLLMGLSLETLLKGLLVKRDPSLVENGRLDKSLHTHSIERLCEKAGIPLDRPDDELNFVRRLTDSVEWMSKYPIPLRSEHLKSKKNKSKDAFHGFDADLGRFIALYKKIDDEY